MIVSISAREITIYGETWISCLIRNTGIGDEMVGVLEQTAKISWIEFTYISLNSPPLELQATEYIIFAGWNHS